MFSLLLFSVFLAKVSSDAVVTLDENNFNTFITENPRVLVEFYAPWCGHCKAFAPEYERAAEFVHKDESLGAKIAKIDASDEKHKAIATKYGVRGFPTLKYFTNGNLEQPMDYSGGRTEKEVIAWIQRRTLPALSKLTTKEQLKEFQQKAQIVLIGYFEENSDSYKALHEAGEKLRELVAVGVVTDRSLATDAAFGDLWIHRTFDTPNVKYSGGSPVTVESITKFIKEESFPLIGPISGDNYEHYDARGLPLVWIGLDVENAATFQQYTDLLRPHATEFKGKLSFVYVDAHKFEKHLKTMGIDRTPGLVIKTNQKYLYQETFDAEGLAKFFRGYKDGTWAPYLKSQPIPEKNDESVKVIVGKSFHDYVGTNKDVFVEYYAPWCGHCKRLAPEYEKVGAAFSGVDSIVIAKVDATENDTPEEIKGFPTLLFYPKNSKTGTKYTGDRSAKAIVDWLKTKATGDVTSVKSEL